MDQGQHREPERAPGDSGTGQQDMLRRLEEAVVVVTSELSLEEVLTRINSAARELIDARHSAIAVLSEGPERRLLRFVHDGLDPDSAVHMGDLPSHQGLLGEIVHGPRAVRLRDISGLTGSPGDPSRTRARESFLGVPLRYGDRVLGLLYLTQKSGTEDFSEVDESIAVALAAAAGVAIENARLFSVAALRQAWLAASVEITARLADRELGATDALQVVADRARAVSGADVAWVVSGSDPAHLHIEVVSGAKADRMVLSRVPMENSLASRVILSGEPMTVEDISADERAVDPSAAVGWPALGPVMLLPLRSTRGIVGVLTLAWARENSTGFYEVDPVLPAAFAEQAALTLQVAKDRRDERTLALYEERDRIARDLHDLVVQRLFAVGLGLQVVLGIVPEGEVFDRVTRALEDIDGTMSDIRRTIFALGKMERATDLQSEIEALVERTAPTLRVRPRLYLDGPLRTTLSRDLASDVLAVLTEALSNVVKHTEASSVEIHVSASDGWVEVRVDDDGDGIDETAVESGLANMRARARRHGGDLYLSSAAGVGTSLRWRVPHA